jgi:hypothetical protein
MSPFFVDLSFKSRKRGPEKCEMLLQYLARVSTLLTIAVAIALSAAMFPASSIAQSLRSRIFESCNGNFVARVDVGNLNDKRARAIIYRFAPKSSSFERIKEIDLPHRRDPYSAFLSDDGRYFVTYGNRSGMEDLAAAIVIFNLAEDKSKVFDLTDLFPIDDIDKKGDDKKGKHTETYSGLEQVFFGWAVEGQDRGWRENCAFDREANILYLTGIDNSESPDPPTITIDLENMTVAVGKTPFWKAHHDRLMARVDEFYRVRGYKEYLARPAGTFHERLADDWLYRLEPGSNTLPSRLLLCRYDQDSHDYLTHKIVLLRNPVAPLSVFFSADLRFLVTLDEVDSMGMSNNTVVIYDLETNEISPFSLASFFPASLKKKLPSGENYLAWRGLYAGEYLTFVGADFSKYEKWGLAPEGPHVEINVVEKTVKLLNSEWEDDGR